MNYTIVCATSVLSNVECHTEWRRLPQPNDVLGSCAWCLLMPMGQEESESIGLEVVGRVDPRTSQDQLTFHHENARAQRDWSFAALGRSQRFHARSCPRLSIPDRLPLFVDISDD